MTSPRWSLKLLALLFSFALVAAACGDDGDTADSTDTGGGTEATDGTDGGQAKDVKMTVTYAIDPDAVWDDDTPITVDDFRCTWEAYLNTPASINTVGNEKIVSVEAGENDKEVVVSFSEVYAPYKNLFNTVIQASEVSDCKDISADFASELPMSGRPFKLESWSPDQAVLVANENYWGDDKAKTQRVVIRAATPSWRR